MRKNNNTNHDVRSITKPKFAGTDPQKVKQEIKKDIYEGEGAMTSREAGSMRD